MMRVYTVRGDKLHATDVASLNELDALSSEVDWLWVETFNPNEEESKILSKLLGNEPTIVENVKRGSYCPSGVYAMHEKLHDYALLSICSIDLEEELRTCPMFVIVKKKMLITCGDEQARSHSKTTKVTIQKLRQYVEEGGKPCLSLIVGMLFREIVYSNSDVMLSIRELIDKISEEAFREPRKKKSIYSVFSLKRKISTLHRLLISEREFIGDVKDRIVMPKSEVTEETKLIIDDAVDTIDYELELMGSYDRTIDSILTIADLASIHKIESSINYLTIMLVIGTIILIVLELLRSV